ncbi:MAG: HlyD family efflux transporter periplasmic adaptor subunit [Saccharofermentanales bacterium]|jgi:hypothetical protein|nr:hypothetical protein [Clostridiaceae bacterium]
MSGRKTGRPNQRIQKSAPRRSGAARSARRPSDSNLPLERLIRIERRKARSRAVSLSIFVMAIMLVTMLLILSIMRQARPSPRFIFIQTGTIDQTIEGTALIIRDEISFASSSGGLLKPLAAEGSRVARGQKLAFVIPADRESQLADLQKCEDDIVRLQTELMNTGKGAGASAIFAESASALSPIINLIRTDVTKGSLANISGYSSSIDVILEQRATKLMTIDFRDARLTALETRKANLEKSLGLEAGTLYCQKPGIVSFRLDGLENSLVPERAETLTPGEYHELITAGSWHHLAAGPVDKDQPVLRISSSLQQFLVFLLPDVSAGQFPIGEIRTIFVPSDALTIENCRIIRSEDTAAGTLLVFRTDRRIERLADLRTLRGELVVSSTTGLKVPVTALQNIDEEKNEADLMIVSGGYTRNSRVRLLDQDREYAIIEAIETEEYRPEVSTILVANPDSIATGEFIGD